MRRTAFIVALLIFASSPAFAADDPMARAAKLLGKRYYSEAASVLKPKLRTIQPNRRATAHLTLGMIYLRSAELHRELYRTSASVQLDYLKKLAASRLRSRSRFVDLYYGEALIEVGKYKEAEASLSRFIADERTNEKHRAIANASLGLGYYLGGDEKKAKALWKGLQGTDPEVTSSLAAAYSRAGLTDRNPRALAEESLAAQKKKRRRPSLRLLKGVIAVYAKEGLTDKGLSLVSRAPLDKYSYREVIRRNKVINFYDLSLLRDLSKLYLQASIASLKKAAADAKLKDTANYYLSEAYALIGNPERSAKVTASFIAASKMPPQFRDRALARQAANNYQMGRKTEAVGMWDKLSKKQPEDPELLAEIILACGRLKVNCSKVIRKAAVSAEKGEGKRYFPLNIALGRYYYGKKDYSRTITFLEAGRDKGNKNKIESNDPVALVDLAEAYYQSKQFSEALEIYFEMSKHFPEVRQIQEAMQGIYSIEQKSAGDVKIF